jgi:carbon-monoxide dehydrogenase medium subunit
MHTFQYTRPKTISEVVSLLSEYGPEAKLLAGGTDLLVRMRHGSLAPKLVIDVKKVGGLRSDVLETGASLCVGALAVLSDILVDERVQRHFPALVEAAGTVGSVQIRNRATLAGNICNASPAADTAPALLVYGALVNIAGPDGARRVPLSEFFTGPGQTVLQRGELVVSIDLPVPQEKTGAAFARLARRRSVDLATISAACLVTASGKVSFAYGAAAPRPILASDESGCLSDPELDLRTRDALLTRVIARTSPISDLRGSREYRLAMLLVMSRRSLEKALERLGGNTTMDGG